MKKLEGKSVIITGAAQGIGKAIALRCAEEGAQITIGDLNLAKAQKAADEIIAKGGQAIAVKVDVAERAQVKAMIEACVKAFGKLDIFFSNAGFNKPMKFLEITEDNWNSIMRVNALGCLICIQEAAKQMIAQGHGGKIILTGSGSGRSSFPNFAPYCASKFAVHSLVQAATRELSGAHHINVNAFAPGVVHTELWDGLNKDIYELGMSSAPDSAMTEFSAGLPIGRVATPQDVAGAALFLASSDSDYITGEVLMVDGGENMRN